jgi:hypothetical protein
MHKFLANQLSIIENAIHNYQIIGGSSIRKAFSDGFTELVRSCDNISNADEADKIALSKVGEVWSAMKVAGKEFVEADSISNAYIGLIEKGQVAFEKVVGLING